MHFVEKDPIQKRLDLNNKLKSWSRLYQLFVLVGRSLFFSFLLDL